MHRKITLNSAICQTKLLTVKEAARRFGIQPRRISTAIRGRHLRFSRDGRTLLVRPKDVVTWRQQYAERGGRWTWW